MKLRNYYVYILANERPTLYIGVTNDLLKRVSEHRLQLAEGFSKEYGLTKLVYYEIFDNVEPAITREKRLKKWNRQWKIDLIQESNPMMKDLYESIQG